VSQPFLVGPMIHLATLPLFRELNHAQVASIAFEADEVVFEPERWIVQAGEVVEAMYVIVDGYAKVGGGVEPLGPGSMVGFPDILVPGPARSGVRADTEVVALRIETDALRELCESDFSVLTGLMTFLATKVVETGVGAGPRGGSEEAPIGRMSPREPIGEGETLDRVDRMLALHRVAVLPTDSMDALAELAGHVHEAALEPGEELWSGDGPADVFWVVVSGALEWLGAGDRGGPIGPGGVVGFAETLAGVPYTGRASATALSVLLEVDIDPFVDLIEDHFELGFSLLSSLAGRLLELGTAPRA